MDLLVVTAGFYGSERLPKMVSIRSETLWGPVFGRVAQKSEVFLHVLQKQIDVFSFSSPSEPRGNLRMAVSKSVFNQLPTWLALNTVQCSENSVQRSDCSDRVQI